MAQNILTPGILLDEFGNLREAGYATSLLKEYRRSDIKASKLRIKEWDYYYIGNNDYGIALTIADNSYMGLGSVSFLNFKNGQWLTKSVMTFFPKGKTNLPSTSKIGDVFFEKKNLKLEFYNDGKIRRLKCFMKNFNKKKHFSCDIILENEPQDSMVIATPFCEDKHFYYNQKINCLEARGSFQIGDDVYHFNNHDSFGVLDWGRGVWTYKNTWYWSSMSGVHHGNKIGFNFGYGFGNTNSASENMIFYDGIAYKVDRIVFEIPRDTKWRYQYLQPWKITSNDRLVDLVFTPILDRNDDTNLIFLKSLQHQVFGKFSGTLVIDGIKHEIKDLLGFAERVTNYW